MVKKKRIKKLKIVSLLTVLFHTIPRSILIYNSYQQICPENNNPETNSVDTVNAGKKKYLGWWWNLLLTSSSVQNREDNAELIQTLIHRGLWWVNSAINFMLKCILQHNKVCFPLKWIVHHLQYTGKLL